MAPHFCGGTRVGVGRRRWIEIASTGMRICLRWNADLLALEFGFACAGGLAGVVSGCSRAALPERRCSQPLTLPQNRQVVAPRFEVRRSCAGNARQQAPGERRQGLAGQECGAPKQVVAAVELVDEAHVV